ncbi:MAG: EAL domain-containing protein [Oscillatoriales cyanobacterium RM2_1_1]|nr:EAL domain-containing protein [Oscillatoriales cyanobacterium SM2_3_0]NJO45995.1 EAL domain-containing protein [Oscillatoriales cyanobacterium RM2_1_1]
MDPFDSPKVDILIVDDTPANLRLLSQVLSDEGYEVRQAITGKMALTAVQSSPPTLILLDILMPGLSGYEVCARLKENQETAAIPIIFLSALDDISDKVKAFEAGGADYVTKPFELEEVLVRVKNQLALKVAEQHLRELHLQLEKRVYQRTQELKLANATLLEMAMHDSLTGLPNRRLFLEQLQVAIDQLPSEQNISLAVLLLDCDRFKVVNDSLGHLVGDELLIALSRRLESLITPQDTLARLGGDEFAILLTGLDTPKAASQFANQILQQLSQPFKLNHHEIFVNTSIGIALGQSQYQNPENLLRDADLALYQAKVLGKGQYHIFSLKLHQAAVNVLELETELHRAIHQTEFVIHYQPIVSLKTLKISGFEALVRWQHPTQGLIYPDIFLPLAEETGLIVPLGQWLLRAVCYQLQTWHQQPEVSETFFISVNLSVRQFAQLDLIQSIDQIIAETQINPQCLKLEMTENVIMHNPALTTVILKQLVNRNIRLGIDDFGTGYSSLSCLDSLPVDTLNIDQSFVRVIGQDESSDLLPVIISLAQTMGMSAVAKGIETDAQFQQLQYWGCDFGQGNLFSPSLPTEESFKLLQSL